MDPFVAEIRIFPFTFAPAGWAFCDGQLMPLSQNTALFSLLGTSYGGDGKSTFALPNLQGSVPVHVGGAQPGPGLRTYDLGEQGGTDTVPLTDAQMPPHTHRLQAATLDPANAKAVGPNASFAYATGGKPYQTAKEAGTTLAPEVVPPAGGSVPHTNLMPYLTLNFCIALQGVFPPRS
jgi:microcystin-dependent protein